MKLAIALLACLAACAPDPKGERHYERGATDDGGGDSDQGADPGPQDGCLDEIYTETLPDPDADIDAILDDFGTLSRLDFALALLEARYPRGAYIVEHAVNEYGDLDCADWIIGDTSTAQEVTDEMGTLVHECGHMLDQARSTASADAYVFSSTKQFECGGGDSVDRGGNTFARSLITGDEFAASYPPCPEGEFNDCDFYATLYLDGDPEDGTFDSGDQGFNLLLEESVQYVNSLAGSWAFVDQQDFFTSARDGILVLMWYVERYLHLARLEYPDAYAYILGDECFRDTVLTMWGRGWLYLDATDNIAELGLEDDMVQDLVEEPVLLDEIERVREATGCRQ